MTTGLYKDTQLLVNMRYSIEHGLGFGILSLGKNIGKNLRSKYSQKLLRSSQKFLITTDALKTTLKRGIQKKLKQPGI